MLLDTHIWVWWVNQDFEKIPEKYLTLLKNNQSFFISIISCLEILNLLKKSKVDLDRPFQDWFNFATVESSIEILNIDLPIMTKFLALPILHKDSMDRIIIATAIEKNMKILSLDREFPKYSDYGLQIL